jgi:hypothetical protein
VWKNQRLGVKRLIFEDYFPDMSKYNKSIKGPISGSLIELVIPINLDNHNMDRYYFQIMRQNINVIKRWFPSLKRLTLISEQTLIERVRIYPIFL